VRTRSAPPVGLEDGRKALQLGLDINAAMAEHHRIAGLSKMQLG
jgi:hypothetical protein